MDVRARPPRFVLLLVRPGGAGKLTAGFSDDSARALALVGGREMISGVGGGGARTTEGCVGVDDSIYIESAFRHAGNR